MQTEEEEISFLEKIFQFVLKYVVMGEWLLNLATLWIRPTYRRMIKTKTGRKIAFKLGNRKDIVSFAFLFYEVALYFSSFSFLGIGEGLLLLGFEQYGNFIMKCSAVYALCLVAMWLTTFGFAGYPEAVLELTPQEASCLWFNNQEDFFKYHDGYFRKEKLAYRKLLRIDEKKKWVL